MDIRGMNSSIHSQVLTEEVQENLHYQEPQIFHDDFLEQMLSTIPNYSQFPQQQDLPSSNPDAALKLGDFPTDEHVATFLCRINNGEAAKSLHLQQQQLLLSQPPLSFASADNSVDAYAPFVAPPIQLQHFHPLPRQVPLPASLSTGGSTGSAPQRQRVRARRGQATDPHSIAERLRRERIAERLKALQQLIPNGNKADKASMLDEIIDYVKFLQLQVKVLSMSRLGGVSAVAPRVADASSEVDEGRRNGYGNHSDDSVTITESQVAKLMEEDTGSAMQYLQGKGLCLMPISLATAISTATCHLDRTNTSNNHSRRLSTAIESTPNISRLIVLSTSENAINGASEQ
ncbi:hypothetical protein RND81_04G055200 [Saponaria officinalis]|uniref:BHLH domain-containing protein n=1 Tax=Saponaria officinalis TaxID=3572 RepID=A0AAW1LGQ7_SAPOF